MVLVKEFRIPMPFSVEEYRRASLYCQGKGLLSDAAVISGTEIIEIDQVEHAALGSCQFIKRRYTLDESFPSFMRAVIPSGTTLEEFHNNSFPVSSSILKLPSFQRFMLRIDTVLLDDCGTTSNAFDLAANVLSKRQVQTIDIGKAPKQASGRENLNGLDSLPANWQKTEKKMMCVYKLVTVEFEYWGLKSAVESYMQSCEEATSIIHNQRVFCWRNQWLDYSFGDVENYSKAVSERVALLVKLRASKASSSSLPEVVLTRKSTPVENKSQNDQTSACIVSTKGSCEQSEFEVTEPSIEEGVLESEPSSPSPVTQISKSETNAATHISSDDDRIGVRGLLSNDDRRALIEGGGSCSNFSPCPSSLSSSSSSFARDHGWTDEADASTHGPVCDDIHWSNPLSPIPSSPLAGSLTSLPLDTVDCAHCSELDSCGSANAAAAAQGEACVAPWVAFGPFVLPPPPPPPSWQEGNFSEGCWEMPTPSTTSSTPWSPRLATPMGAPSPHPGCGGGGWSSPAFYPGGPLDGAGSVGSSPFPGPSVSASPSPWIGYAGVAPECPPLACGMPSPLPAGPLFGDCEAAAAIPPRPQAVFACFTLPPPPPPPSSPPPCSPCASSFDSRPHALHFDAASPWGWEGRDSAASWLQVQ